MATKTKSGLRSFKYIKIYLTFRWMCNKFGCTNPVAERLTNKVLKKLNESGNRSPEFTLTRICKTYNAHLRWNRQPHIDGERYSQVHDTFHNIVGLTFTYASKHPFVVDDLLKKKPKILNTNMKRLWTMYKKRTWSEEVIFKKMNKTKLAVISIRDGMFVRLCEAYEKLPEFGPYYNK